MKIEILLECLIVLMLEYWRSQITQTIRQSDNQAFIQEFFGLWAVCRLNHVPKADWLGKPRFEAISLTLNLPLRSCRGILISQILHTCKYQIIVKIWLFIIH